MSTLGNAEGFCYTVSADGTIESFSQAPEADKNVRGSFVRDTYTAQAAVKLAKKRARAAIKKTSGDAKKRLCRYLSRLEDDWEAVLRSAQTDK